MPNIIIRWLITTLAILMIPKLVSGVQVDSLSTALVAAAILGILNALIKPVLILLTLPLTILTLGFFILVINALLFQFAGWLVKGLHIDSFISALFGSLIVSIVSWGINALTLQEGTQDTYFIHRHENRSKDSSVIDLHRDKNGKWE